MAKSSVGAAVGSGAWLVVVALAEGTARAAEPTAHVTWAGGVRASDNVFGAPDPGPDVPDRAPRPVADVGVSWSPGVMLRHISPRARWVLAYSHPMLLYARHPLAHQSGDALGFAGSFLASARDVVDLDARLLRSSSTLTSLVEPVAERDVTPYRSAAAELVRALGAVRWRHDWSERWAAFGEVGADVAVPLDDGAGLAATRALGAVRASHETQAFDVAVELLHLHTTAGARRDTARSSSDLALVGTELRWSWDATARLSAQATLGVSVVAAGLAGVPTRPTGSVALGYDHERYAATAEWRHAFVPSALTGQLVYGDTVALRGRVPIVRAWHLEAASGSGIAWTRVVDEARGLDTGVVTTAIVDVALEWAHERWPRVTLGYQFTHQASGNPGQLLLPTFDRSVASLGAEYVFPPPAAGPVRRPRRRVDSRTSLDGDE